MHKICIPHSYVYKWMLNQENKDIGMGMLHYGKPDEKYSKHIYDSLHMVVCVQSKMCQNYNDVLQSCGGQNSADTVSYAALA